MAFERVWSNTIPFGMFRGGRKSRDIPEWREKWRITLTLGIKQSVVLGEINETKNVVNKMTLSIRLIAALIINHSFVHLLIDDQLFYWHDYNYSGKFLIPYFPYPDLFESIRLTFFDVCCCSILKYHSRGPWDYSRYTKATHLGPSYWRSKFWFGS